MKKKRDYVNSVNLHSRSDFPYLVLHAEDGDVQPRNPGFRVMHWHEDLQFLYVMEGRVRVSTLETAVEVHAGRALFINRDVVHFVEPAHGARYKSFVFPEYFVSFYFGSPAEKMTQGITRNPALALVEFDLSKPWHDEVLRLLAALSALEREKVRRPLYSYETLLRLSELWYVLLRNIERSEATPLSAVGVRMKAFLGYIEVHYAEEITLESLSKSASVSKSECLRCFRTTLNTTPYKYLMDYRLLRAAQMLKESSLPVGRIAELAGFRAQSYFGKCFREKLGCAPSAYRRQAMARHGGAQGGDGEAGFMRRF